MLTKSKYVMFCKCPRLYYLNEYSPELAEESSELLKHFAENGNKVGELARSYFPNSITISRTTNVDMANETENYIKQGTEVICEASFIYEDLFCAVDVLKINKDGSLEVYEVKSSSKVKDYYIRDLSFQVYVLKKLGYKISKACLLLLNEDYVFNDHLDIKSYFKEEFINLDNDVEDNINKIHKLSKCPDLLANEYCINSGEKCPFFKECFKDLPKDNIFSIGKLKKKYDYFNKGIRTFSDFYNAYPQILKAKKFKPRKDGKKTVLELAYQQVDRYLNNKERIFNKDEVNKFLNKLEYPLYYLDFETYRDIIPFINGLKTNYERVIQYSLDVQEYKNGPLKHYDYISEKLENNMYEVANRLVQDLGNKGSIIVYNKGEESNRIESLAEYDKNNKEALLNIKNRIVDLMDLFSNRYIYENEMMGKYSIKVVLPVFVPEHKDDYKNLDGVHNGADSIAAYEKLIDKNYDKHDELKQSMIYYCSQDTLSMVEVLQKVYEELEKEDN